MLNIFSSGKSRIWGEDVVCNVRAPSDDARCSDAPCCPPVPDTEQRGQVAMRNLERRYAALCRKHIGQGPPYQSFGRWLMERSIRPSESSALPAVSSADEVSPCMRRELCNALLSVPERGSDVSDYKAYLSSVEPLLTKRPERVASLSTVEAGVLVNKSPACLKLIKLSGDSTGKERAILLENCEAVVGALQPIVDKVIFADVDTICREMSAYVQQLHGQAASQATWDGAEQRPQNGRNVAAKRPCSPPVTWNSELERQRASTDAATSTASLSCAGVRTQELAPAGRGQRCTLRSSVEIRVPAGRGWKNGGRGPERRRLLEILRRANCAPCSECRAGSPRAGPASTVTHDNDRHLVTVSCGGTQCTVAATHARKLMRLYEATCSSFDPGLVHFPDRLLCMLKRYETLLGDMSAVNLQGAMPLAVFEYLHAEFGVTMECFASPLNCYFPQYCSAYPDTDRAFGSRGSFFSFSPVEGSLAANPPFCEEVIDAMADHFEQLLEATTRPLSFIVVIPEWRKPPTPGALKLDNSKFLRKHIVLSARSHMYRSGKQHLITSHRQMEFTASFGTEVFFLQNESGNAKWPVTDGKLAELRRVFGRTSSL